MCRKARRAGIQNKVFWLQCKNALYHATSHRGSVWLNDSEEFSLTLLNAPLIFFFNSVTSSASLVTYPGASFWLYSMQKLLFQQMSIPKPDHSPHISDLDLPSKISLFKIVRYFKRNKCLGGFFCWGWGRRIF